MSLIEDAPAIVVGPLLDPSDPDAAAKFKQWILEQHVQLCRNKGIDCRSCDAAEAIGLRRPS